MIVGYTLLKRHGSGSERLRPNKKNLNGRYEPWHRELAFWLLV
jgi:hypothetical protein